MARLEYIDIEDNYCANFLEEFRQYASVPDHSRDALLTALLKTAVLKVQEFADRALVKCTVRQTARVPESGVFELWLGGGEVESVDVPSSGWETSWSALDGQRLRVSPTGQDAEVVFRAEPKEADLVKLKPTVFRYGTALYDGEDTEVLNRILLECLCH